LRPVNESWNVSYAVRDNDGNDMKSINMSWERQSLAQALENLNTFLVATGAPLKVVQAE
jgi:hypothetical protein